MESMMKAARLYGAGDIRVENMPAPDIADDEILVRVKAATVCGTDLRMYKNGLGKDERFYPLIPGHEFSGLIEKTGRSVTGYEEGQRVCVAPNTGCGICDICVSGNSHHCKALQTFGLITNAASGQKIEGAFAEFVRVPAAAVKHGNVVPLPDNVSFEAAAANEAFACVMNSFERYGLFPGDTVLIIGAGAIGMMHAALVLMAGAARVILNDLAEDRLAICKNIEPRIITVSGDPAEAVQRETGGKGADVVITACSVAAVQEAALSYAALNGRVNYFGGLPGGQKINLDTNIIHYKQLAVTGTTRSRLDQYRKTLSYIANGRADVDSLVTHRFPIEDIGTAIENALKQEGLKQAVVFE